MGNNTTLKNVVEDAARAETPAILFSNDLSLRLHLPTDRVRDAMRAGCFGPWFAVDGEPAVTSEAFSEHVRLRAAQRCPADRELMQEVIR